MAGLEEVLAAELEALGAQDIMLLKRAVTCTGDKKLMYRANYELRTALRVLIPIDGFSAGHEEELYKKVRRIDWSQYMSVDGTLAVDATVNSKIFTHSKYIALKAKDGIVDRFRRDFDRRPNVALHNPDLRIHLYINDNQCTVFLDSSGESLHKRGYRKATIDAPMSEVLAAGIVQLTGWRADCDFIDPMCGSGTLPIEAGLYARNIPPQLYRPSFGFMRWRDFDAGLWKTVQAEAKAKMRPFPHRILGFDRDHAAVRASIDNVAAAGLSDIIQVQRQNFDDLMPGIDRGILVMNPPYDERLKEEDIAETYKHFGDCLKKNFTGFDAWIFSGNLEAAKRIGLRASRRIPLFNGPIECRLLKYELYMGTRKQKAEAPE